MDVPPIRSFQPTDNYLLEWSERTRLQMSVLYHEPNHGGDYWLDATAPLDLFEVVARYRRCLGREFRLAGRGDIDAQTLRESGGHKWIYSSREFKTGGHLAAGAAALTKESGTWRFEWFYIHPFERDGRLIGRIKEILDEIYPDCMFVGPFSKAGRTACLRLAGGRPKPPALGHPQLKPAGTAAVLIFDRQPSRLQVCMNSSPVERGLPSSQPARRRRF